MKISGFQKFSGGRESELGVTNTLMGVIVLARTVLGMAVRAAGTTGLGAGPKGLLDDR
jgi:hypothetical protein